MPHKINLYRSNQAKYSIEKKQPKQQFVIYGTCLKRIPAVCKIENTVFTGGWKID